MGREADGGRPKCGMPAKGPGTDEGGTEPEGPPAGKFGDGVVGGKLADIEDGLEDGLG